MKLYSRIIKFTPPLGGKSSFFAETAEIQNSLVHICENWATYLQEYVDRTAMLFGEPEFPWENTERALVSTLSGAIIRSFKGSVLMEEVSIPKSLSDGRCDLWVSIPNPESPKKSFNFYLETKTTRKGKEANSLSTYLKGFYGVSKIFRDYLKSRPSAISKLSPYYKVPKDRIHEHFVVGMLITRLSPREKYSEELEKRLREVFEDGRSVALYRKGVDKSEQIRRARKIGRFPTVALVVHSDSNTKDGMIASFTVLGSTRKLHAV